MNLARKRNWHDRNAAILAVMIMVCTTTGKGQDREVPVKWGELAATVGDRGVSLAMPDGTIVEGRVVDVLDDSLSLRIKKSSDPRHKRDTTTSIPRASVRVLQMQEIRGSWRAIGTAIGVGGGAVAGWALAEGVFHTSGEGSGTWSEPEGPALILGIGAAAGVAGYFAGRSADRRVTYLKIVP